MTRYHPQEDMLIDYATGTLSEPFSLLIATHLALCPACRAQTTLYEAVGGAMLEGLDEVEGVDEHLRAQVLAKLDTNAGDEVSAPAAVSAGQVDGRVPQPLRGYLKTDLDHLDWKKRGLVEEVRLLTGDPETTTRLLKIKAGKAMPRHTHGGVELTLVLSGGFTDQGVHYGRGDLEAADTGIDHAPVADADEDCYCLAVNDKALRLSGPLTRFLNPFVRL